MGVSTMVIYYQAIMIDCENETRHYCLKHRNKLREWYSNDDRSDDDIIAEIEEQ